MTTTDTCYAERTGEGYWTCDVPGGCPGCFRLALASDAMFEEDGEDETLRDWRQHRAAQRAAAREAKTVEPIKPTPAEATVLLAYRANSTPVQIAKATKLRVEYVKAILNCSDFRDLGNSALIRIAIRDEDRDAR